MSVESIPGEQLTIYGLGLLSIWLVGRRMLGLAREDEEDKRMMKDELKKLRERSNESEAAWKVCEAERKGMQHDIDELRKQVEGKRHD